MFASPIGYDNSALHRNGAGQVAYGSDAQLFVEFFNHPVEQGLASVEAGRPIYKDVPYIRITVPSNTGTIKQETVRAATEEDKRRFPRHWEAFAAGLKDAIQGTPLEEWALMPRSEVMQLKHFGVHSIEQLAALSDSVLSNLGPGWRQWQDRAKAALNAANNPAAAVDKLSRENDALRAEISALTAQVRELASRIPREDEQDETDTAPRRRGRPPKTIEN